MNPGRDITRSDRWPILVKNDSGETVPPYALMRVTGAETNANGQKVRIVGKPTGASGMHLVNGPKRMTASGQGAYGYANDFNTTLVAYNTTDVPVLGDAWGPANNSWLLTKGGEGWETLGGAADGRVVAARTASGSQSYPTYNFQLYQDTKKYTDDTVQVKLCDDELAPVGDPFELPDPHNEFSSGGQNDAYGRCTLVRDADTGDTRLEITHLQNIAQIIYGTLDEDMGYVTTNVTLSTDAAGFGPSFERSAVPDTVHLTGDPKLVGGMRAKAAYVAVLEDPDAETPLYRIIALDWNHINVQLIGNKAKSDATRTCYVCEDDLSPTAVEVTVADPHLTFEGKESHFGVAKWSKDDTTQLYRLEFEHINLFAEFIQGTLTTDMSTGTGTATVNTYFGGHFEGQNPGSEVTVVSGVDCHDELEIGDEVVAVRYNSITPTYMIISGCPVGGGTDLTPGCGIIIEEGTIELDPTIACDGLYWDSENCCMGIDLPDSGYLYIDGSGQLDVDIPTLTVNSFEGCELEILDDELVLTIKYKACTVHAPTAESCGSEQESTCSIGLVEECE